MPARESKYRETWTVSLSAQIQQNHYHLSEDSLEEIYITMDLSRFWSDYLLLLPDLFLIVKSASLQILLCPGLIIVSSLSQDKICTIIFMMSNSQLRWHPQL